MVKLKDIADLLQLSVSTVSRVLNDDKHFNVADETREKVWQAAEKLGYVHKRKDGKKNAKQIGLITWHNEKEEMMDPYYLSIRLGVEKQAFEKNIQLNRFFRKDGKFDFEDSRLDGIIAIGKFDGEELAAFSGITPNIVFVDDTPDEGNYDSVITDFERAVFDLMDYLHQCGHRAIGFIGGRDFIGNNKLFQQDLRELAYIQYMKRKGLFKLSDLYIGRITPDDGYTLAQSMLKRRRLPSAVFIANDLLVIGAMRAFHEHGVKIPQDISIVGFNDNDFSRYLMPALTTVKVHTEWMGKEAVNLLLERLNSARSIAKKVILPAELVKRESCRVLHIAKTGV